MTRLYDDGDVGLSRESGCAGCAGTCMWKRLDGESVRIPAPLAGLAPGDRVEIRMPAGYALAGALVAYGLPLAGLLAGAAIAAFAIDDGDVPVLLGALVGCAGAYRATGVLRRRIERQVSRHFRVRRLPGNEC